ncbi:MAG TPA: DUF2752 domain-containing protein [Marmoricola sp.]|nr:DUF2752 domain-containing protein [Marmoricola sp.]
MALRLRDPHVGGSWGLCPLRLLTGLDCPACGGLRAVNDLTRLRLDAAFHSNALFVVAVPLLLAAWGWWLAQSRRGRPVAHLSRRRSRLLWWSVAAVTLAFTVFRNTPWGRAYWA